MLNFLQRFGVGLLLLSLVCAGAEARPQNLGGDDKPELDSGMDSAAVDEARNSYYELPAPGLYPNVPMDRLQMLFAQYRPTAFLRAPSYNSISELYRMPESKRQVRYRQCYFNPISCFKK